jgi:hypothetical protein
MSPRLKNNLKALGGLFGVLCGIGLTFILVFTMIIGDIIEHGKRKLDGSIPDRFPVVVRVGDRAQIVLGDQLDQFLKNHPNHSLLIPEHQTDKFQSQIKSNIRAVESPPNFDKTSDRPWAASFTVQTIAPEKQAFKVYATWDDDWMNVGWYEATDKEIFPQFHTRYFGPGLVFAHMPIAAGITMALWIILLLIVPRLTRRLRHRFAHSEEQST